MDHILSLSGGKDSTAMLLHILELLDSGDNSYPLDEVVFVDTGLEFPQMYDHLARLKEVVESRGIRWTTLRSDKTYEYYMFEDEYIRKDGKPCRGHGWATPRCRWCTGMLKTNLIDKYRKDAVWYTGIAADETARLAREQNKKHKHPLADWGWTEAMCLAYCYDRGYEWGGVYEMFTRVSCWCCPLQTLDNLKALYYNFPELWAKLIEMDEKSRNSFRSDYTFEQLQIRFDYDREIEGKALQKKDYYAALYRRFDAAGCPRLPKNGGGVK